MSESLSSSGPGMKLHTKILLGLAFGATAGIIVNMTVGAAHPVVVAVNDYVAVPIGQIFLRMLFMVVMPLVFASIALGVCGQGDIRKVGRIGGKA
ncbi:MAG: cation:dicarboxylase symporter family transporter, partial [Acidobacteriota bacterium]|nr:cation:dicarboxylase symporter family transporter [Acidobacteriota bacterium]